MIDAVAEKGYVKTTVSDVLKRAGVSRATFYEQFDDKADCFDATYREVTDVLAELMDAELAALAAQDPPPEPLDAIDTLVGAYLDLMCQTPSLAKVFLVEVYATGPAGIARRRATIDVFVELIESLLSSVHFDGTDEERRFTIRTQVVTLVALVTEAAAAGEVERIAQIRAPFRKLIGRVMGATTSTGDG